MAILSSAHANQIETSRLRHRDAVPAWQNARFAGAATLESLLDYEMRCAARYRRFTSLILVSATAEDCNIQQLLMDVMRSSDEFFQGPASGAILMGETDNDGALNAVHRYKMTVKDIADLRFAIATYPSDAHDVPEMLAISQRRLAMARTSPEFGKVVASDS